MTARTPLLVRRGDTLTNETALAAWIAGRVNLADAHYEASLARPASDGSEPPPPEARAHRSASRRPPVIGLTAGDG